MCRLAALSGLLALSACAAPAPDPDPAPPAALITPEEVEVFHFDPYADPAYPPVMGSITGTQDGSAVAWTTYDFSVGAYDASAWFGRRDGVVALTMTGYPPGDPRSDDGLIRLTARVEGPLAAGTTLAAGRVALIDGGNRDSPRPSGDATLTLDSLSREQAESGYGRISGSFAGALCPPAGMGQPCQQIEGRFDTAVQFDGL